MGKLPSNPAVDANATSSPWLRQTISVLWLPWIALWLINGSCFGAKEAGESPIFCFAGSNIYASALMGRTQKDFVRLVTPMFSWKKADALSNETRHVFGRAFAKQDAPAMARLLGQRYDLELHGRLLMLLAEMVADDTGVRAFHYDPAKVEIVLRKSAQYEADWDAYLEDLTRIRNADQITPLIAAVTAKWQSKYAWHKPGVMENIQKARYGRLLDTHAIAIELAERRLLRTRGWEPESGSRRWVKVGNFSYESRFKINPEIAARHIDEYARDYLQYNFFLVRLTDPTALDKLRLFLEGLVTEDGCFAEAGLKRLMASMPTLGGDIAATHESLTKTGIQARLGLATTDGLTDGCHGPATNVDQEILKMAFPQDFGGSGFRQRPICHYFVIRAIKGSDGYARDPREADPCYGSFCRFLSTRYLGQRVELLLKKVSNKDLEYFPKDVEIRDAIAGLDAANVFRGWEPDLMKPIDAPLKSK